ncbi:hypothetical protein BKA62DRAFT_721493 [Auriculariales sp. MPI-PUGE-AT-0066]|nr:hypothetical protein BKA62DRAFT_721493 [Auriculariales sp. MPI-PUGE-AT-0066]
MTVPNRAALRGRNSARPPAPRPGAGTRPHVCRCPSPLWDSSDEDDNADDEDNKYHLLHFGPPPSANWVATVMRDEIDLHRWPHFEITSAYNCTVTPSAWHVLDVTIDLVDGPPPQREAPTLVFPKKGSLDLPQVVHMSCKATGNIGGCRLLHKSYSWKCSTVDRASGQSVDILWTGTTCLIDDMWIWEDCAAAFPIGPDDEALIEAAKVNFPQGDSASETSDDSDSVSLTSDRSDDNDSVSGTSDDSDSSINDSDDSDSATETSDDSGSGSSITDDSDDNDSVSSIMDRSYDSDSGPLPTDRSDVGSYYGA